MRIIKKKGSIIPRYLIEAVERKSQHQFKFGCDVEIIGNKIYMIGDGCCFYIPNRKYCNLKKNKGNNKRLVKGFNAKNIYIDGSKQNGNQAAMVVDLQTDWSVKDSRYK